MDKVLKLFFVVHGSITDEYFSIAKFKSIAETSIFFVFLLNQSQLTSDRRQIQIKER